MPVYIMLWKRQRLLYDPKLVALFTYPAYLNSLSKYSVHFIVAAISIATAFFLAHNFTLKSDSRGCYGIGSDGMDMAPHILTAAFGVILQGLTLFLLIYPIRILRKQSTIQAINKGNHVNTREQLMGMFKRSLTAALLCFLSDGLCCLIIPKDINLTINVLSLLFSFSRSWNMIAPFNFIRCGSDGA